MSESKTIYCGSGKKQTDKWLKVTINPDKLKDHIEEFKGNRFIKLNINIKDEVDDYGKDVSISVDTWKPEPKEECNKDRVVRQAKENLEQLEEDTDDLPF